jgi:DNA-directed RNA polymerase subunit beta
LPIPSLPSSFKLLTKQLQGLCLAITVYDEKNNKHDINDFTATIINEKNEKKEEKSNDSFELTEDVNDDFSLI